MRLFRSVLLFSLVILLNLSCSSIPREERIAAVNTKKEQAALFLSRGHNEYGWSNYDSSMNLYTSAFTISASVDWLEGMIRSLVHLSRSADGADDKELSYDYLEAARELLPDADNDVLQVLVGNREAEWLLFHDSPERALQKCRQIIELPRSGNTEETGETWRLEASILKKMRRYEEALLAINKAVDLDESRQYIAELASDYYIRASILSLSGREGEGIESMLQALHYDKFIENTAGIAQDLYALALIYEKTGKTENANHYFQRTYLVYSAAGRDSLPPDLVEKLKKSSDSALFFQETDVF